MMLLFETPVGFALFKVLDEGKLSNVEDLGKEFSSPESARKMVKLKAFDKFDNIPEALEATVKLLESAPSEGLLKFLKANCEGEALLGVADPKLGNMIKEKLKIDCVHNNVVMELLRGVRSQLTELISGLSDQDLTSMRLGLSHILARHKLKISSNKDDTTIIQTIGLLDDLDKELDLKEAALISMGTEVSDHDLLRIRELCDQILSLSEYRAQLYDYLESRMNIVAPNLTALVGELVGARLISHGGGLLNLAKLPGSTIQILGAEKSLKSKHATLKYGLIYHAPLVAQAAPKHKGNILRSLAAKAALAIRCDAFGDGQDNTMGVENRAKLEARLRDLEGKDLGRHSGSARGKPKNEVYDKTCNTAADSPAKSEEPSKKKVEEEEEELTRGNLLKFMLLRFTKLCNVHVGSYFVRCFGS